MINFSVMEEYLKSFYNKISSGNQKEQKDFFAVEEYLSKKGKEACDNFEKFFKLELESRGRYLFWSHYKETYEKYYEKSCDELKREVEVFQENCPDLGDVIDNNKERHFDKLKTCLESQKDLLWEVSKLEDQNAKELQLQRSKDKQQSDQNMKKILRSLEDNKYASDQNMKKILKSLENNRYVSNQNMNNLDQNMKKIVKNLENNRYASDQNMKKILKSLEDNKYASDRNTKQILVSLQNIAQSCEREGSRRRALSPYI